MKADAVFWSGWPEWPPDVPDGMAPAEAAPYNLSEAGKELLAVAKADAQAANAKLDELVADVAAQLKASTDAWLQSHCICAAQSGVVGHAKFCPLGDGIEPEYVDLKTAKFL
jgi:hypothetical protein